MSTLWGSGNTNMIERVIICTNNSGTDVDLPAPSVSPSVALPLGVQAVTLVVADGGEDDIYNTDEK